jgi:hypothetical protein
MIMTKLALVLALLLAMPFEVLAAKVKAKFNDQDKKAILKSESKLVEKNSGKEYFGKVNKKGEAEFDKVEPGEFQLYAQSQGYMPNKSDWLTVPEKEASFTLTLVAEDYYRKTIRYFGTLPRESFWLWEKRCKLYLYDTQASYLADSRQPAWSGGYAVPSKRSIISYQNAPRFLESILPHELAHLIFREFVGFKNSRIPAWLDEGFAVWQETEGRNDFRTALAQALGAGKWIPFPAMNQMDRIHHYEKDEARLFYAQAESMVSYLLDKRDSSYFTKFARDLRDGYSVEEALRRNYAELDTLDDFEEAWKRYAAQTN